VPSASDEKRTSTSVGCWLNYARPAAYPIDDFREIKRWYAGLMELPAWRESIAAPPF
jgi:hypothetical protein